MQLRRVDPRILTPNPNNPRRTAVHTSFDKQLAANMRETNGPIQPPVVRERTDGGLTIVAGHRRVLASIMVGLGEIDVFVRDANEAGDSMAAFSENMMRSAMSSVDVWKAIEAFIGEGYTEDAISTALSIPVRAIRKLRLFASIHTAMLDRMAQGDEPNEQQIRTIASATRDEQAAVWKKYKPKKNDRTDWSNIEHALRKQRISASVARFDAEHAEAFGIRWTEDLFAEGGTDARFTDQVDLFMAAQQAWLEANLPSNGIILELGPYGSPQLPPKAHHHYGRDKRVKGVRIGLYVDPRTGQVEEQLFQVSEPARRSTSDGDDDVPVKAARPDISKPGHVLIGQYRTTALHQALGEAAIADADLIGLLVLALAGDNVHVDQDQSHYRVGSRRGGIARTITEGGVLSQDIGLLRVAARGILQQVMSCALNTGGSGVNARVAAVSIQADRWLPNMAHDDFLTKLSKNGITEAIRGLRLLPRNTGKEMRAALKEQVGQGTWVHPTALFSLTDAERQDLQKSRAHDLTAATEPAPDDLDPDGDEVSMDPDAEGLFDDEPGEGHDMPPQPDVAEHHPAV